MNPAERIVCTFWLFYAVASAINHDPYGICACVLGIAVEFMDGWLRK